MHPAATDPVNPGIGVCGHRPLRRFPAGSGPSLGFRRRVAAALLVCAGTPVAAQTLVFTGQVRCGGIAGTKIGGGAAPIVVTQRGFAADYVLDLRAGMGGFTDRGRGSLVGLDLSMRGGGGSATTLVSASRSNRNYRVQISQQFPGGLSRACEGWARLGVF